MKKKVIHNEIKNLYSRHFPEAREKNQRWKWPLWKTDESYLRYYNITPTFILEVKLRVSAWITHNVSPCSSCCIFSPSLLRANFVSLSVSCTCSLTRILLLSCHACSSFYSVFSKGRSNGPPLSQNSLLGFSSFLHVRAPVLASRDQTLCAVSDETHETATVELDPAKWKSVGFVGRSYVTRSEIAEYFAQLGIQGKCYAILWSYKNIVLSK